MPSALRSKLPKKASASARAGYYPSVDLFASYGSSYSSLASRGLLDQTVVVPVTTEDGEPIFVGGQPFTFENTPREGTPFGDQFFTDNRGGRLGLSVSIRSSTGS